MWPGGDEAKPPTNTSHVRMYGHNLCPFVTRARYAFACKEVPYQEVLLCLNNKSEWHKEFNGGMLPVLESPAGELIPESGIQVNYALEAVPRDQGIDLIPQDPIEAAKMRAMMAKHDSIVMPAIFGVWMSRF